MENDNRNEQYDELMGSLKSIQVEPSPYLKTRILANHKQLNEKKSGLPQWVGILIGSMVTACLAFLISWQMFEKPAGQLVATGQPYLVKADIRKMNELKPAYVRVELIGAVEFSSAKHKHIREMRSLKMSWEKLAGKQYLPVVVKGLEDGESHVKIQFYDENNNLIESKDYQFNFQGETT